MEYISSYEYESNVNPTLKTPPIASKNIRDVSDGITKINFSEYYNIPYPATSPNLLAHFIKLKSNQILVVPSAEKASSHFFYVIEGKGEITVDDQKFAFSKGDIFIAPVCEYLFIYNSGKEDNEKELQIYYINDSPLLNYLGSKPIAPTFKAALYSHEYLQSQLQLLSNPNNNRKGILLSNQDTEKIGTNTITPVLWALYNELPPHAKQRPHRHNSVALDLCIYSSGGGKVYTLISESLDAQGELVNPTKVEWNTSEMFITPPGLWHSHHNEGDENAYVLPIQDAGILLYQRILGIEF